MKPVIVIVGYTGAGKEEATKLLVKKEFVSFSGGDMLRRIAKETNLPPSRENLITIGNALRREMGGDVLMRGVRQLMDRIEGDPRYKGVVVDSLRNPMEVEFLQKETNAMVVEIAASPETRLDRIITREKLGDPTTLEGLQALDRIDHGIGQETTGQNIAGCVALADFRIENEGTVQDLERRIDELLIIRGILEGQYGGSPERL